MYSLIILPLEGLNSLYRQQFPAIAGKYNIRPEEITLLYDWTVCQAINKLVDFSVGVAIGVYSHYRHEVYEMVYEEMLATLFEQVISKTFSDHALIFNNRMSLKVMVLEDTIMIARTLR